MQNKTYTSQEDIYKNLIVAVFVHNNGQHIKITSEMYDKLGQGKSFRTKEGLVFSNKDKKDLIYIDDYTEK